MNKQPIDNVDPHGQRLAAHETFWQRFGVHRATRQAELPAMATGSPTLDRQLPGGGYPIGAVTELLCNNAGLGELSLLLHGLARRMREQPKRQLAFIAPPPTLQAPALTQAGIDCARVPLVACRNESEKVWCVEQMARANAFAGFVVWADRLDTTALRRLQLAAEKAACPVFVYRHIRAAAERSPAALRLAITASGGGQRIEILKCRGPAGARIAGLRPGVERVWQFETPRAELAALRAGASNDIPQPDRVPHVARSSSSPLGAR
ncbi:translesion DNA synthesis-associated protein ImuA [uncultured Salinisphaera sp.]|uniref:translesion DNA synthesis-associated protein ImuA n=1 Tax=uncultured Salinisphaera sp. TaxID=359372 RepID=UPI0032B21C5E